MSVNHLNHQQVKSREEYKKIKEEESSKTTAAVRPNTYKRVRIRLIPIWLRVLLLVMMIVVSVIGGAAVGYGILGDGQAGDVLKQSTWNHILELIEKK
ncbi:hydroxymyristoyl-ACP dehydratase [Bacillus sp. MRMR6]|nr:hydroxymyristoyl-ACP dehydratase [Bacillus sp. MRMR6]